METSRRQRDHLLLYAAALLLIIGGAAAAKRCGDCGNTSVPYPLSTGFDCGDRSYKIRCESGRLRFDTINSSYPIRSINPTTQRFLLEPARFAGNTCTNTDFVSEGVQLNASLPFNISNQNTILYLNCADTLLRSPLNCTDTSPCHAWINATRDGATCRNAPICCTFRTGGSATSYSIRIRRSGCRAYRSFANLDTSVPVTRWPEPSVEIQWLSPPEPICRVQSDCDDNGNSTCRPGSNRVRTRRCYCNPGLHWDPISGICAEDVTCFDPDGCSDSSNRTRLIAGLIGGLGAGTVLAVITFVIYTRRRRIREAREKLTREREEILNAGGAAKTAKLFSGKEMKKATNNFSKDRLLGSGGFGDVYKGILNDGTPVAIKCAKIGNAKGTDQVLNEVRILCQVNHRSLVRLLGCCVELEQPLMVYEYIPNGTLLDHLQTLRPESGFLGRVGLTWILRLNIARSAAEGLAYLHSSAVPPIYHRDVKSSNILLDEKLEAKVSDFGLSRLAQTDMSHVSTCAQGTLGYLDPEYYRNYQLTDKSDVYSFGVVLLELLTSQKAIDFNRAPDDVNLAVYAQRMVEEERLLEIIDPFLKDGASGLEVDTMKALGFLAASCLEERRQNRPSMKEVVEETEYIISIATAKASPRQ